MRCRLLVSLLGVVTVVAGCGSSPPAPSPEFNLPPHSVEPKFGGVPTLPPPDMTDDGAGSLVEVAPLRDPSTFEMADAAAVRMVYRSTSGDGEPTEVSGVVAVPPGSPPRGGWPIISFGHAVTGTDQRCTLSLAPNLAGYAGVITPLLQRGFVVAMSDYQGLGVSGYTHSVIDTATLGRNIIDAARAARRVLPTASDRWAAFGSGEGGLAAWAAAEMATAGDGGLKLVGAVALSPLADLSGLVDKARDGNLSREQKQLYIQVLLSAATTVPNFDLDDYRSGVARERWDILTTCAPPDPDEAKRVLKDLSPDDLRPRDEAAAANLRGILAGAALPQPPAPSTVPILVIYASEDPQISPKWIDQAVSAACRKGDPVEAMYRIGDSSGTNYWTIQAALNWVQSRLDGQRPNACKAAP